MKSHRETVRLFAALGERLESFGDDAASRCVIEAACRENGWFHPGEISRAVSGSEFLDPEKLACWLDVYSTKKAAPERDEITVQGEAFFSMTGRLSQSPSILSPATCPASHPPYSEISEEQPVSCSRTVLVVMAGNIPLVGFFDLLCVIAAGHRCLIKPSNKDTVLMRYVVGLLCEVDPEVPIEFYDGAAAFDAVIATGSANANRHFRATWGDRPALLRSDRYSIAVLDGRETQAELEALADDVFSYSGLGCRNVSMIFVPTGTRLHLPAREVSRRYRDNYRQRRALRVLCSEPFEDLGFALLVPGCNPPQALSEVSLCKYNDIEEITTFIAAHEAELQCIVSHIDLLPGSTPFGVAQRPSLHDYADRRDTMEFLLGI